MPGRDIERKTSARIPAESDGPLRKADTQVVVVDDLRRDANSTQCAGDLVIGELAHEQLE